MRDHINPTVWPECDESCDTLPAYLPQPTRRTRVQTLMDRIATRLLRARWVSVQLLVWGLDLLIVAAVVGLLAVVVFGGGR